MSEKAAIAVNTVRRRCHSLFSHMEIDVVTDIPKFIATTKYWAKKPLQMLFWKIYVVLQSNRYIKGWEIGMEYVKRFYIRRLEQRVHKKLQINFQINGKFSKTLNCLLIKPQQLVDFIINEHPQTFMILAHRINQVQQKHCFFWPAS